MAEWIQGEANIRMLRDAHPDLCCRPNEDWSSVCINTLGHGGQCGWDKTDENPLINVLLFYADPETYHGISILGDPPCGEFIDDFSEDHEHPDYPRPMPGATARDILRGLHT